MNLTIKRNKSFVGCLAKLKVWIEDEAGELVIGGVPCRLLGDLKNGEEKRFEIPESDRERKLFVIADCASRNYCNDFVRVPVGDGDLSLSGKCHFNPAAGNAFRFDGVSDAEVLENRKKSKRRGLIVLLVAILIGAVIGGAIGVAMSRNLFGEKPKTFSSNGMSLTLTTGFRETSMEGYTVCYDSKDVAVFVLREGFDLVPGVSELTLDEYVELVRESNKGKDGVTVGREGNLPCMEYRSTNDGTIYYYYTVMYKSSDAFWLVQFATKDANAKELRPRFVEWAKTVKFE